MPVTTSAGVCLRVGFVNALGEARMATFGSIVERDRWLKAFDVELRRCPLAKPEPPRGGLGALNLVAGRGTT